MPVTTYVWIGLVVMGGAFIQGAVGFAFGIFSIPMLVWVGLKLEQAIVLVLTLVIAQTASSCWSHREHIPWRQVLTISVYRFLTVPIGVLLLKWAGDVFSIEQMKQFLGFVLLGVVSLLLICKPARKTTIPHGWSAIAGASSGILAGLVGMGGPPAVLWAMAHEWTTVQARAFLWTIFLLMVPWQLLVDAWQFGHDVYWVMGVAVAYVPLVIVAGYLGAALGSQISITKMRVVVYAILIIVGGVSVAAPWL